MRKYFGTDGIRGKANHPPMTPDIAQRLGMALVEQFRHHDHDKPRFVIGKDTRISGYLFETSVASGITAMGGDVLLTGPLPTPGIAFITRSMRADAGVVISASHNPFYDNGIKVFDRHGYKLSDEVEERLEQRMADPELPARGVGGARIGRAFKIDDAVGRYVQYLKSALPNSQTLEGLRIVVDCAHGAAYKVAPMVFSELGARVVRLGTDPDGLNINQNVGALHPQQLAATVLQEKADLGVALDGDADRLILVDGQGQVVDGDRIMAILAQTLERRGQLKQRTVVATVMSNLGLERWLEARGMTLQRTAVGDRYILERLRENGLNFGGEQSGHMIYLDYSTTGDGVLTALLVLSAMVEAGHPLSALPSEWRLFPQELRNVKVERKPPFEEVPGLGDLLAGFRLEVGERGRVLLRYSGTENLARVMVEGEDAAQVSAWTARLAEHLEKEIGGTGGQ